MESIRCLLARLVEPSSVMGPASEIAERLRSERIGPALGTLRTLIFDKHTGFKAERIGNLSSSYQETGQFGLSAVRY